MTANPAFTLNNGVTLPPIGFGVFQRPPDETATAVVEALRIGYRHVDTAASYFNERGVGEGIRRSGVRGGPNPDSVTLEASTAISRRA